jgi:hypothetical protein
MSRLRPKSQQHSSYLGRILRLPARPAAGPLAGAVRRRSEAAIPGRRRAHTHMATYDRPKCHARGS